MSESLRNKNIRSEKFQNNKEPIHVQENNVYNAEMFDFEDEEHHAQVFDSSSPRNHRANFF